METTQEATECDTKGGSVRSAKADGTGRRKRKTAETWEQAVELSFTGRLTQDEIAAQLGVSRKTLYRWRKKPEMVSRAEELHRQYMETRLKDLRAKRGW